MTTAPTAPAYIRVVISDRGIAVGSGSSATRGTWVIFHVLNRGRSSAKLSFLGRVSRAIAPGRRGSLAVFVDRRGAFPVVASLSAHRQLRQSFFVY
jgi:hypothetical protein